MANSLVALGRAAKAALVLMVLSAGGCGYHLRGSIEMPESMKNVYVVGASSLLQTQIVSILKASKSNIAPFSKDAGVVIKITKEDIRNRVVSIGTTGKSTESEVNYYLRFQYFDNKDKPLQDEQTIEMAREFFNDQTAVLAKASEELMIREEIYKQAARMLIARAKIALDNQQK